MMRFRIGFMNFGEHEPKLFKREYEAEDLVKAIQKWRDEYPRLDDTMLVFVRQI